MPTWIQLIAALGDAVEAQLTSSGEHERLFDREPERAASALAAALDREGDDLEAEIRIGALGALAPYHFLRYDARRGTATGILELREAVRRYAELVAAFPGAVESVPSELRTLLAEPDPSERRLLAAIGEARGMLAEGQATSDLARVREGIELLRAAVAASPAAAAGLPESRFQLGMAWRLWFEITGDPAALDECIAAFRAAAHATRLSDPRRAERHQVLYSSLHERYRSRGDRRDVEEAVAALGVAAAALPAGDERRPPWLIGLARDLLEQSHRNGALRPAQEALRILESDLAAASRSTPVDGGELLPLLIDVHERIGALTGDHGAFAQAARVREAAASFGAGPRADEDDASTSRSTRMLDRFRPRLRRRG